MRQIAAALLRSAVADGDLALAELLAERLGPRGTASARGSSRARERIISSICDAHGLPYRSRG